MRKLLLILLGSIISLATIAGIIASSSSSKPQVEGTQIQVPIPSSIPTLVPTPTSVLNPTDTPSPSPTIKPTLKPKPTSTPNSEVQGTNNNGLSNDNYYTNTQGNEVHSPAYSNTVPAGATAICGDGTYSFSQSRRGTCSHHGGVTQWL